MVDLPESMKRHVALAHENKSGIQWVLHCIGQQALQEQGQKEWTWQEKLKAEQNY